MTWSLTFFNIMLLAFPLVLIVIGSRLRATGIIVIAGMMMAIVPWYLAAPLWLSMIYTLGGIGMVWGGMLG